MLKTPETVAVTEVGELMISTVNLHDMHYGTMKYETCVFYPNGDSDVVRRYATESEALLGHGQASLIEIENVVAKTQQLVRAIGD
jgi:hypothetical protein